MDELLQGVPVRSGGRNRVLTDAERGRVVAEARLWAGTPYHHKAGIMGVACDCAYLLLVSYAGAGLIAAFTPESYTRDWHLHRGEEKYLFVVERYARAVDGDETPIQERDQSFKVASADILMFRHGRTYSHAAIVTEWPYIIHAYAQAGIVVEQDVRNTVMSHKDCLVYSYCGEEA